MRHDHENEKYSISVTGPNHFTWGWVALAIVGAGFVALVYTLLSSSNGLRIAIDILKLHGKASEISSSSGQSNEAPPLVPDRPATAPPPATPAPPITAQDDDLVLPDPKGSPKIVFNPYPAPYPYTLRPLGKPRFVDGGVGSPKLGKPFNIDPRIVNNMPELVFIPYGLNGPTFELCWSIPRELQHAGRTKTCITYGDPKPLK